MHCIYKLNVLHNFFLSTTVTRNHQNQFYHRQPSKPLFVPFCFLFFVLISVTQIICPCSQSQPSFPQLLCGTYSFLYSFPECYNNVILGDDVFLFRIGGSLQKTDFSSKHFSNITLPKQPAKINVFEKRHAENS